jgi:hypothetical protein
MAPVAREYSTIDLRGLRGALMACAARDGVSESDVLRSALAVVLGGVASASGMLRANGSGVRSLYGQPVSAGRGPQVGLRLPQLAPTRLQVRLVEFLAASQATRHRARSNRAPSSAVAEGIVVAGPSSPPDPSVVLGG